MDNNRVTVYEFPDIETAKSHASGISSDGYSIKADDNSPYLGGYIQWSEKPYFYQKNRLIVKHTISDETFLADLEKILEKPITE